MSIAYAIQSLIKKLVTIVLTAIILSSCIHNTINLETEIPALITLPDYISLQTILDTLSKYATPRSIIAHQILVSHIKSLTLDQIKELFYRLKTHGESTLKMALRLVYTKTYNDPVF